MSGKDDSNLQKISYSASEQFPQKNVAKTISNTVRYAQTQTGYFDVCVIFFVTFLVVANICATKVIQIGPLVFDGGAITFPLTYVLGDVISEVYGLKAAKKAIKFGFIVSFIASATFAIVALAPAGPGYENQAAFEAVLGFVPRIVFASLCGYLVGEYLNAYVLVWIKNTWGEKRLWVRLVGSTLVGEIADTLVFCVIAFLGTIPGWDFLNYLVVGYIYKVTVEVVFLPVTYWVIGYVKQNDPSYHEASK